MTFKPAKGPCVPPASQSRHHYHHGAGAAQAGGGMGIQIGYGGDPLPPSSEPAGSGGPGLYTAFKNSRPVLAVLFTDGRFGHISRAGSLNVLEVDKAQALELATQLIAYAKLPDGTNMVTGTSGGGAGGAGGAESVRGL